MTTIIVLNDLPIRSAKATADIHLRQQINNCCKVFSGAIHFVLGDKIPTINKTFKGVDYTERWLDGLRLFLKPPKFSEWHKWTASNVYNAWWLIELASQLQAERQARFKAPPLPEMQQLSEWIQRGFMKYFKKPSRSHVDAYPVEGIPTTILANYPKATIPELFMKYYEWLHPYHRLKWSAPREMPLFFAQFLEGLELAELIKKAEAAKTSLPPQITLTDSDHKCDCGLDFKKISCNVRDCPHQAKVPF